MFGLESFKLGKLGQRIGAIIEDKNNVRDMIALCRNGIPAVQAVGKTLLILGPDVKKNAVKQKIGRWVREIMSREGWTPLRPRRVSPGNLFSTGMVYAPKK